MVFVINDFGFQHTRINSQLIEPLLKLLAKCWLAKTHYSKSYNFPM